VLMMMMMMMIVIMMILIFLLEASTLSLGSLRFVICKTKEVRTSLVGIDEFFGLVNNWNQQSRVISDNLSRLKKN
jgi:hypothetical protein